MSIHTFQPGDEAAQADIYNAAAGGLPSFKAARVEEVRRRAQARGFDPTTRFVAVVAGQTVGYATFQPNGRVSYPWCRLGAEASAEPLFAAVLATMAARGVQRAFAAYHKDWTAQAAFFEAHGFPKARDVVNFVQELTEMPTMVTRSSLPLTPLAAMDVPALIALAPGLWRGRTTAQLHDDLFRNPLVLPESYFAIRGRSEQHLLAAAVLVNDPTFADPSAVDPWQPCFRLGAFGTEGLTHKRINGLFSFVAPATQQAMPFALSLMGHAAAIVDANDGHAMTAQCPSDQPHLLRFYTSHFRRQGHFPVFERTLPG